MRTLSSKEKEILNSQCLYSESKTEQEDRIKQLVEKCYRETSENKPQTIAIEECFGPSVSLRTSYLPTSRLNSEEIAEVLPSEMGFTIATDAKPRLATYGCSSCVAVALYDPTNRIAFLAHFAHFGEFQLVLDQVVHFLSQLANQASVAPLQMHLRGGEDQNEFISQIQDQMRQRLSVELVSKTHEESLLIDARDGSVTTYRPLDNPKRKEFSEADMLRCLSSAIVPNVRMSHFPELPLNQEKGIDADEVPTEGNLAVVGTHMALSSCRSDHQKCPIDFSKVQPIRGLWPYGKS